CGGVCILISTLWLRLAAAGDAITGINAATAQSAANSASVRERSSLIWSPPCLVLGSSWTSESDPVLHSGLAAVDRHDQQDQDAEEHLLGGVGEALADEHGAQLGHQQRPENRVGVVASQPEESGAADDHRGKPLEQVRIAEVGVTRADEPRQEDTSGCRGGGAEGEHHGPDPLRPDQAQVRST